jgi:hypothetical protein
MVVGFIVKPPVSCAIISKSIRKGRYRTRKIMANDWETVGCDDWL